MNHYPLYLRMTPLMEILDRVCKLQGDVNDPLLPKLIKGHLGSFQPWPKDPSLHLSLVVMAQQYSCCY